MPIKIRTPLAGVVFAIFAFAAGAQSSNAREVGTRDYHIDAQSLPKAVNQWADQAGMQVMWAAQAPKSLREAPEVFGRLSAPVALERVLAGSGFTFAFLDERTVSIRPEGAAGDVGPSPSQGEGQGEDQRGMTPAERKGEALKQGVRNGDAAAVPKDNIITEVIVTGTHIRGVKDSASPVRVYTREQIDNSGIGTVQAFVQSLPQNFKGGAADDGNQLATGNSGDYTGGSGVNLRGLGNDATLVLVNGRRIAPGGTNGNFVDISMLPLSAIERVEVVTDGASAVYGSDAVGGVVNFILRRDFDGAETRARYGTVNDGGSREIQVGEALGQTWGSGSVLLSYEYYDRSPLSAGARSYTRSTQLPFDLLPEQRRHGAFLTLNQSLTPSAELFFDGNYAHRSTSYDATLGISNTQHYPATVDAYSGTLGARTSVGDRAGFEFSATYGANRSDQTSYQDPIAAPVAHRKTNASTLSLDTKVDGELWELPGGPIKFAVGAQYRDESLDVSQSVGTRTQFQPSRDLFAGFLELRIPVVGPTNDSPSRNRLEISIADRAERYSDFGSSNNPQFGMIWSPHRDLRLRGTYGTSFKAPLLNDLNPTPTQAFPFPQSDPSTGGLTNVLVVLGGNADLQPEDARTWTAGFDIRPEGAQGFQAGATYYNIHFKQRITNPQLSTNLLDALRSESVLGSIVQRDVPNSVIQQLASTPGFIDFCVFVGASCPLASISVLVDGRLQNLSIADTSGLDLNVSYQASLPFGHLETGVDATRILKFENQFTAAAPAIVVLNTPYNPVNWRGRARAILSRESFSSSLFANYVNSYADNRAATIVPVASWLTFDLTASYRFATNSGLIKDGSVTFGILNVSDKDPPFLSNPQYPLNYDAGNANVLGRFFTLQLTARM
jgi:outer membrane receptor protein involved in Fe transport